MNVKAALEQDMILGITSEYRNGLDKALGTSVTEGQESIMLQEAIKNAKGEKKKKRLKKVNIATYLRQISDSSLFPIMNESCVKFRITPFDFGRFGLISYDSTRFQAPPQHLCLGNKKSPTNVKNQKYTTGV